ncbi:MAG TPA: matrixin family metalloprotease [Bryobacteraceae bacterium]|nr:matrixin family metalloprotease [Bryobacteraceae bacterium]
MPAEAYFHYTYYFNGNRSTPIRARFSVASTTSPTTITVTVDDDGASNYGADDGLGSVVADLRQAIAAWNQVSASQLKLAFGGLEEYPQTENAPGIDVTFTELPPGILGFGTPNLPANPTLQTDALGQFVPIQRSTILLTTDTSQLPGPTYREMFFTTAVHELGHALGLQHTWTGAAMTPSIAGSNTTRARPIDADDIAALSVLYGAPNWASQYGTISGHVNFTNNTPVSMASVVALPVDGPAVSALTNPDGSYTINGLPNKSYFVYVHPLPPDAVPVAGEGLLLPEDQSGSTTAQPSGAFQTNFFPGTLTPPTSGINIQPGNNPTINFSVRAQNSVSLYDVQTIGYIDPGARNYSATVGSVYTTVSPAFASTSQGQFAISASSNSTSMPSLQSVTILGGFAPATPASNCSPALNRPCFFTSGSYMVGLFNAPPFPAPGVRHMIFSMANDIFVLPNALTLVQNAPPVVNSVNTNSDGSVTVSGNNFGPDTAIYLDGLAVPGIYNSGAGSINITPPPGNSGQTPLVAAYNGDGQNSTFLQYPGSPVSNAPTYSYASSPAPTININTSFLNTTAGPSGFSTMVDITGNNTNFLNGQPALGFGTSDVTVSKVWALSPTHLVANVVVAPNAAITSPEVSVVSGFQVALQPFGIQIQPPNPALPVIGAVVNNNGGQGTLYPGASVTIYGTNLPPNTGATQLTLTPLPAGQTTTAQTPSAPVSFASTNQVNFVVPPIPAGAAVLTLGNGNGTVSLVVPIALPPPVIASIINASGSFVDSTHSAGNGDLLTIQANGLDPTATLNSGRLQVSVGGIVMQILALNGSQIQFSMNHQFGGALEPVLVTVDGSSSLPYTILTR